MTDDGRRYWGGQPELAPEDQALLNELLPEQDERPGPARRRAHATSEAMVLAVLQASLAAAARAEAQSTEVTHVVDGLAMQSPRRSFSSARRPLALLAASLVFLSLGSFAATMLVKVVMAPKPAPAPIAAPARPVAPVVEAPAVEEEPTVEPEPEVTTTVGKVRPTRHRRVRTSHKVAAARQHHFVAEVDLSSAPLEDLLALANTLRRSREWASADEVYKTVIDRFPGTDAAVVAQVVSATLHVDQLKDAPGALDRYRLALAARPMGALAEEARWGVAVAFRTMGDRDGELKALHEFLEHHGTSPLAPAARRRVAALDQ